MAERDLEELLEKLVGGAKRNDEKSWYQIVHMYDRLVWRVAREQGLDAALASDVAQTTWLRLAEHIRTLEEPKSLPSWLATTARREAWRVSARARRELPDDIGDEPSTVDLETSLIADERAAALWRALGEVDERCQRLIRMLLDEVPYKLIAKWLDLPVGSLGPTRKRCLAKIEKTAHMQRLRDG